MPCAWDNTLAAGKNPKNADIATASRKSTSDLTKDIILAATKKLQRDDSKKG